MLFTTDFNHYFVQLRPAEISLKDNRLKSLTVQICCWRCWNLVQRFKDLNLGINPSCSSKKVGQNCPAKKKKYIIFLYVKHCLLCIRLYVLTQSATVSPSRWSGTGNKRSQEPLELYVTGYNNIQYLTQVSLCSLLYPRKSGQGNLKGFFPLNPKVFSPSTQSLSQGEGGYLHNHPHILS